SVSNGLTIVAVTRQISVPAGVAGFSITVSTLSDSIPGEPRERIAQTLACDTGTGGIIDTSDVPSIGSVEAGAAGVGDDNVEEGRSEERRVGKKGPSRSATSYGPELGDRRAIACADFVSTLTDALFRIYAPLDR